MIAFADGARPIDPAARERLQAALDDADPMEAFREALRQHPEEREKWFLFRTDRMHDRIERWLADHGVRLAEPPPWKLG
jgi:hypothetical protein